jgi:hypothetical protein
LYKLSQASTATNNSNQEDFVKRLPQHNPKASPPQQQVLEQHIDWHSFHLHELINHTLPIAFEREWQHSKGE